MTSRDEPAQEPVGSVAEEAAKLFGALSDWAGEHLGEAGEHGEHVGATGEHVGAAAEECRWCPVCRTVHALRTASPEVGAHLAAAVTNLAQAAAGLLAAAGAANQPEPRRSGVERIDLDADHDSGPDPGPDPGPEEDPS